MFSSGHNSKLAIHIQHSSKHARCPKQGHWLGMSNFFQLITLLLIENIYFTRTRVKDPYTLAQISPSTNPSDLWEVRPNFKSLDLWKARPKFNFNGPLGSTSKLEILGLLESTSKIQFQWTFGKHVQTSNPWTSGKHVQNSRSYLKSSFCRDHLYACLVLIFFPKKKKAACMNYV